MIPATKEVMACISEQASKQGPHDPISRKLIQETYNIPLQQMDRAMNDLERAQYIEFNFYGDYDNFEITQSGNNAMLDIGQAPKINNVTIHGDVNQSAIAVDHSQSSVTLQTHQLFQKMIQEIEASPDFDPEEKKSLIHNLNQWSQDSRFLAIAQLVLGNIFQ